MKNNLRARARVRARARCFQVNRARARTRILLPISHNCRMARTMINAETGRQGDAEIMRISSASPRLPASALSFNQRIDTCKIIVYINRVTCPVY